MPELTRSWTYPLRRRGTALLTWWIRELLSLVPAPLRRALGGAPRRLILNLEGGEVVLTRQSDQDPEPVGRYPLTAAEVAGKPLGSLTRGSEVILCLPDDHTLTQRLILPVAVEENLRRVLGYMMDRNTPFTAEQVYYDGHILGRRQDQGLLEVELTVAPRAFVDKTLGELKGLGLEPSRVAAGCAPDGRLPPVNLLPPERRPRGSESRRRLNGLLAVLALGLLGALLVQPLWEKHRRVQALEEELERVSREAQAVAELRERLERLEQGARFLEGKRATTPLALSIMAELTRLVPDDTWISDLRIAAREVQITGFSAAAAALIPILDGAPMFSNVRFLAPVTQDRLTERERFQLVTEVASEPSP